LIEEFSPYYGRNALIEMFSSSVKASDIIWELQYSGNGSRGIVAAYPNRGVGHIFNVVNTNGTILAIDGQLRIITPFADYLVANPQLIEFYFMQTK
jgi:hypothetical protein